MAKWLAEKDYLLAGRTPPVNRDGLTVADLLNHFWNHKKALVASGELAPRSFERYDRNGQLLVDTFGKDRLVDDLTAQDFEQLRGVMSKRWGPVAVAKEIQMARSVFRYGYEARLIDKPVRFGPGFKKPSAKVLRQTRAANGPQMFEAAQIQAALKASTVNMRAVVDHVRAWLFPPVTSNAKQTQDGAGDDHQETKQAPTSDERPAFRVVG